MSSATTAPHSDKPGESVRGIPAIPADRPMQPERDFADVERLLSIARGAGMLVMLDAQIGRERYQSVAGSVVSLQRFAAAICQMLLAERTAG